MYPWLPEGPLMTQWAPAVIRGPLVSWAPSRQGGPRVTWWPLLEQVAPPGRNPGYVPASAPPAGRCTVGIFTI